MYRAVNLHQSCTWRRNQLAQTRSLPGVELKLPFLSEQDISDITFAAKLGMDYVAASFVQKADDVLAIRRVLEEVGSSMGIISKIENHAGVKILKKLLPFPTALWLPAVTSAWKYLPKLCRWYRKISSASCNKAGKPVITATQMLESMITSYRATRAEASDIANAIFDGTDDIMLSGETASGKYPLERCAPCQIAEQTETALDYAQIFKNKALASASIQRKPSAMQPCRLRRNLAVTHCKYYGIGLYGTHACQIPPGGRCNRRVPPSADGTGHAALLGRLPGIGAVV